MLREYRLLRSVYTTMRCNPNSLTQVPYKEDLLNKLEIQYAYKKQIYKDQNMMDREYLEDLKRNYIYHILIMLVTNVYQGPKNIDRIRELKEIRNSSMVRENFKEYQFNSKNSLGIALIILLMKIRRFRVLDKMMMWRTM